MLWEKEERRKRGEKERKKEGGKGDAGWRGVRQKRQKNVFWCRFLPFSVPFAIPLEAFRRIDAPPLSLVSRLAPLFFSVSLPAFFFRQWQAAWLSLLSSFLPSFPFVSFSLTLSLSPSLPSALSPHGIDLPALSCRLLAAQSACQAHARRPKQPKIPLLCPLRPNPSPPPPR